MFTHVLATGMITEIYDPTDDKTTYMTLKVSQTILLTDGTSKPIYAEVMLKLAEGYEKYTGKVELGDLVSAAGRFEVSEAGGPVFSENDGLPHFVIVPFRTNILAHAVTQTGADVFSVILIGNLGRDPEMRYTPNGAGVTNANLATSRKFKIKGSPTAETTWWRISFWNKLAETVNNFCQKGQRLCVEGHVRYDDKTHGPTTYEKSDKSLGSSFEITGYSMTMLGGGKGADSPTPMGMLPDEDEETPAEEKTENPKPEPEAKKKIPF